MTAPESSPASLVDIQVQATEFHKLSREELLTLANALKVQRNEDLATMRAQQTTIGRFNALADRFSEFATASTASVAATAPVFVGQVKAEAKIALTAANAIRAALTAHEVPE